MVEFCKISEDYKLVYQGGHHNIYCNAKKHLIAHGLGWTRDSILHAHSDLIGKDEGKVCDCDSWKKGRADVGVSSGLLNRRP